MRYRLINSFPVDFPAGWFIPDPAVMWVFALLIGLYYAVYQANRTTLNPIKTYWACIFALIGGLWGGHLLGPAVYGSSSDPFIWFRFWDGGKVFYGGVLGGALTGFIFLKIRRLPILLYIDAILPAVFLGYTIGRLGCFLNGCCFGTLSDLPWAVRFPYGTEAFATHFARGWVEMDNGLSLPVHPTQLYHAGCGVALFLILRKWQGTWTGSRLAMGMASYGIFRFFIQFIRGDRTPVLGFLDINQVFSLIFIAIAGLLWWRLGRKQTASSRVKCTLPSADARHPERL